VERLAASVPDAGGVYLVPAFAGLGAPHWDQYARGTITGITRGTTAAHFARAALESIAFQVADILQLMQRDSGVAIKELRVDGGASANDLLMQMQADQLQVPVQRPRVQETTALGAAYLAGLAEGVWSSLDELATHWALDAEFTPKATQTGADARHAGWLRAVERSRGWAAG
jgi:glycerol kinase